MAKQTKKLPIGSVSYIIPGEPGVWTIRKACPFGGKPTESTVRVWHDRRWGKLVYSAPSNGVNAKQYSPVDTLRGRLVGCDRIAR
jgi:hypothetical protein